MKKKENNLFTGVLRATESGVAFITPDDREKYNNDFFVPHNSMGGAYDGDSVAATHIYGTRDEAKVVKILRRGTTRLCGTLEKRGKIVKVYPDNSKLPVINIPLSLSLNANRGDKVLCEITAYPKSGLPNGKIIEILGESGEFDAEELSIIRSYGLYEEFDEDVLTEADNVSKEPVLVDGRIDLTDKIIFTIDGADTRDIDDAVSIEVVDGKYILGVHIADVSHYVLFGSTLDKEAYSRGTSVYFPDRVLPMLPKQLSNGICSLNEGENRYALSCIMEFDASGNRLGYKIFESVICSRHKMTYPEITAICECDGKLTQKYSDIIESVIAMKTLCNLLEKKRVAKGQIDLDVGESKIYIDQNDDIIIKRAERGISERMIEQFMIAANEAVAEFLQKRKAPCLYRIHEVPSPDKTATLLSFIRELNIKCNVKEEPTPKDFQNILKRAKDKPFYSIVNKVMLRSMQKARYDEKNLKHFGLASDCYCHFTSPIRRYPDLFVHRAVKAVLYGDRQALKIYKEQATNASVDCSQKEQFAEQAERDVDDLYKVVYMSDHIGEVFDATISGVTRFGIFCELDNSIEGLIPIEVLPNDNYMYMAENFALKGIHHTYKLGDSKKILVDDCDFGRMRVMFSLY